MERRTHRMHSFVFVVIFLNTATACTRTGWSDWINDYPASTNPFPGEKREPGLALYGGDKEDMNGTTRDTFCAPNHGIITDVQCATAANGTDYLVAQAVKHNMSCEVANGFKCINRLVVSGACLDYKVRLFCNCTKPKLSGTPSNKVTPKRTASSPSTKSTSKNAVRSKYSTVNHVVTIPGNGASPATTGDVDVQGKQLASKKNSAVAMSVFKLACFLLVLTAILIK